MKCEAIFICLVALTIVCSPVTVPKKKLKKNKAEINTKKPESEFCYEERSCGSKTWGGVCTSGSSQSPIDLDGNIQRFYVLPPTSWNMYDGTSSPESSSFIIQNTGNSIEVNFPEGRAPILKGATIGLPGDYRFAQMHFHWGKTNSNGSEHTLSGESYALELHIVHFSTKYNDFEEASHVEYDVNAIAITAIFYEISPNDNTELQPITDAIPRVHKYRKSAELEVHSRPLNLQKMFPKIQNFYRYWGSLTTPGCMENRVWTVFKQANKISPRQMATLRSVFRKDNENLLLTNHRPIQPRNGRPVWYYIMTTGSADYALHKMFGFQGSLKRPLGHFMLHNRYLTFTLPK